MSVSMNSLTTAESRALALLGNGIGPEQVAQAVGLTASRISQLLSDEHFAAQVAELRFEALSRHNERDSAYDSLEDELIEKMRDCLPLMVRPQEVLRAIQVINAAKRRGFSAPTNITEQHTIINLIMPTSILSEFSINANNQVVQAGDQPLVTIQSGTLLNKIKGSQNVLSGTSKELEKSKPRHKVYSAEDF